MSQRCAGTDLCPSPKISPCWPGHASGRRLRGRLRPPEQALRTFQRRTSYAPLVFKVFKLSVCRDRPVSTAQNLSLLLWACVWATDMVCVPVDVAKDHEPKVCGDRPVSVAQYVSLFALVCVWLTDMVCVLWN